MCNSLVQKLNFRNNTIFTIAWKIKLAAVRNVSLKQTKKVVLIY